MLTRFLIVCAMFAGSFAAGTAQGPAVGDTAPDFSLRYATRDSIARMPIRLSSVYSTGYVILAFYPADWSSGCTKEVCAMRDDFALLSDLRADVLAISGDYVYSHHEWAKAHNLPFRLLSDHDHRVSELYGSYNADTGYNKRTVFVIDTKGIVRYKDMEYSVRDDEDFGRLKEALASLRNP